jgi:Zn-dependent M16 (insulinase) family peptidase
MDYRYSFIDSPIRELDKNYQQNKRELFNSLFTIYDRLRKSNNFSYVINRICELIKKLSTNILFWLSSRIK